MLRSFADRFGSAVRQSVLIVAVGAVAVLAAAPPASASVPLRGVVLHSLWPRFSDSDIDRELDLARAAGSTLVDVDVAWASLELSGKGQMSDWYLSRLDRFVNGAAARRMKVLAVLWASPCWASSAPNNVLNGCTQEWNGDSVAYPPSNLADYGDIVAWLTARYGTKLAGLEVWNEPNLATDMFWNASNKAAAYAKLVRATYARVKAVNPAVRVVIGALVRADTAFLRSLYARGIKGYYDAISLHTYGGELSLSKLNAFRAAQRRARDSAPLWITEFGAPTSTGGVWRVTERGQAAEIKRSFSVLNCLPYVKAAALYSLRDTKTDRKDYIANFGVLRFDLTPKLGWAALKTALKSRPRRAVACKNARRTRAARR
jgi:hypothetical protein